MILLSYLQNMNVKSKKMTEKAIFEIIRFELSLLKLKTFSEKL